LRHEFRVAQALHQHDPGTRDVGGVPTGGGRLTRKPVAWHRRNHYMESVRCAPSICRGIDKRINDLQLLDDRTRPQRDDRTVVADVEVRMHISLRI